MNTIGPRIRELRKTLMLSGEKFGEKIGLTRMAISNLENGRYNITEQSIIAICHEFNANEQWLRSGEGEMFNSDLAIDLSNADPLEQAIIKAYFSISKDERQNALRLVKDLIKNSDS